MILAVVAVHDRFLGNNEQSFYLDCVRFLIPYESALESRDRHVDRLTEGQGGEY